MTISCPRCNSTHIKLRNIARRAGGRIGTVAGATSGSIGLTLGEFVDDYILYNYQCHDCGQRFSTKSNSATSYDSSRALPENIFDHEDKELDQH